MAQFDLALPKFGPGDLDDEKQRRRIMNYLVKLDEQLRFVLNNLDAENFTENFQQIVISGGGGKENGGADSESLKALQEELNRLSTRVTQTANEIALKASAEELNELGDLMRSLSAEFKVLADEISSKVSKEEYDSLKGTVNSHSTQIQQTAEAIRLKADKTTVDTLSGTVSEHSAQFEVTAEQISSTVSRVDTLEGSVSTHETRITQTAEKVESTAKAVETLDGTVSDHETRITQTAEKIETKADKTVVDELGNVVSENSTAIVQTAEKIEATATAVETLEGRVAQNESSISQTPKQIRIAVESVQIGGTNLLKDSAKDVANANYLVASYDYGNRKPDAGDSVTVRIWGELGDDRTKFFIHNSSAYMWIGDLADNGDGTYGGTFAWRLENENYPEYNVTQDSQTHLCVYAYPSSGTSVSTIDRIKMEIGNKATDWSPAPEDAELEIEELSAELSVQAGEITANATAIQKAQSTADSAQTQANANKTNLSSVTTRVTTAETSISALDGKVASKVEQTEFDELGKEVSRQATLIEETSESILLQAARTVGGTNYLLDSAQSISNSAYNIANYYFSDGLKPKAGENVTVRIWGSLGSGKTGFGIWNTNGYNPIGTLTDNGDGTYSGTFEWKLAGNYPDYAVTEESQTRVQVYAQPNSVTGVASTIKKIKLERGDYATDWTPHPEDPSAGVNTGESSSVRVKITPDYFNVDVPGEDGDFILNEAGGQLPVLVGDDITAPNVAPRYDGPATLYVDPNATSSQIAAGNYYRSLADAVAKLNGRMTASDVTINLAAGMTEYGTVTLKGVLGGGWVVIAGNASSRAKLAGRLNVYHNGAPIRIRYLNVDSAVNAHGISVANGYCEVLYCTITGQGTDATVDGATNTASVGIMAQMGGRVQVSNCELYDVYRSLYTQTLAEMQSINNKGNCIVGANRTHMFVSGTAPSNSASQFNYSEVGGGKVWPGSVTVDQGSKPTPEATPTTTTFSYLYSDSYCGGWSYFSDEDVRQGVIQTGSSGGTAAIYGVIWFDAAAIKSAIGTKTVKQASLRLYMLTGYGRGVSVSVQLYGTSAAYSGRSSQPALTKSYGTISEAASPGETNEITIPAAVINDIVSGAIQALVLKSDDTELYKNREYSKNYARFSGTGSATADNCPRLTVVYR